MKNNESIYVAGHTGLVGSAIVRNLRKRGDTNLILRTHDELDLTDQHSVKNFFEERSPDYVYLAAAKVGGILENSKFPADFAYQNIMIACNVIHASYLSGVKKLLFLGSSCVYPRLAAQPMGEHELLSGRLEKTNEAYAIAKIAGLKMCDYYRLQYDCDFISAMPTNLYGPNDNFDLESSHVVPALIRKFNDAKLMGQDSVEIWGTGSPLREFLYVDDLVDALIFLMQEYSDVGHVNIGSGHEITIKDLSVLIREVVGFEGNITYNTSYPDGTPRKLLDSTKMAELGWTPSTSLREGLAKTYEWYLENYNAS
ncbi:MAG: GDP-L-fucose synthase family protein [Candidatus Thorarchaeota archaeon]